MKPVHCCPFENVERVERSWNAQILIFGAHDQVFCKESSPLAESFLPGVLKLSMKWTLSPHQICGLDQSQGLAFC